MVLENGRDWAPAGPAGPVTGPGEFVFSAVGLEHGHVWNMTQALLDAGGTLKYVYDPDEGKVAAFLREFPQAKAARREEDVLEDRDTRLVASAAIPCDRCALGLRVMEAGKDYFTDKAPMTTLEQVDAARACAARTGRKYMVYYSERLHSEAGVLAGYLLDEGRIGRPVHVSGSGPHKLGAAARPDWFFRRAQYGGILIDIGSHQIEQFLAISGAKDARIAGSRIGNFANPGTPELDDFGDCAVTGDNGAAGYFQVNWYTPDGLRSWGDGRTVITGTEGYLELRKYVNVAEEPFMPDQVYLVDGSGEHRIDARGAVGYPFFGQLILDSLERTERAMTQEHAFLAAELSIRAQMEASELTGRPAGI